MIFKIYIILSLFTTLDFADTSQKQIPTLVKFFSLSQKRLVITQTYNIVNFGCYLIEEEETIS